MGSRGSGPAKNTVNSTPTTPSTTLRSIYRPSHIAKTQRRNRGVGFLLYLAFLWLGTGRPGSTGRPCAAVRALQHRFVHDLAHLPPGDVAVGAERAVRITRDR